MTFETDEIATAEEYQLSDGWGAFIDRGGREKLIFADIVAKDWWDGRAVLVEK